MRAPRRRRSAKDRITDIEERIAGQEKRLRIQFTAMEKALSMSQNQGNWLLAQMGSMQ